MRWNILFPINKMFTYHFDLMWFHRHTHTPIIHTNTKGENLKKKLGLLKKNNKMNENIKKTIK